MRHRPREVFGPAIVGLENRFEQNGRPARVEGWEDKLKRMYADLALENAAIKTSSTER
jgi:hypothetical protein